VYHSSYPFVRPLIGAIYITPLITGRGPPCRGWLFLLWGGPLAGMLHEIYKHGNYIGPVVNAIAVKLAGVYNVNQYFDAR